MKTLYFKRKGLHTGSTKKSPVTVIYSLGVGGVISRFFPVLNLLLTVYGIINKNKEDVKSWFVSFGSYEGLKFLFYRADKQSTEVEGVRLVEVGPVGTSEGRKDDILKGSED